MSIALAQDGGAGAGNGNAGGTGTENAGGSGGQNGGAGDGSSGNNQQGGFDAFLSGLSKDNQEFAKSKGWAKAEDANKAFDSHRALEKAFSGRDKAASTFKASDYEFKKPANAEQIGYSDEFWSGLKSVAAKHGIAPEALAAIHDHTASALGEGVTKSAAANVEALNAKFATAEKALTTKWGNAESPEFKRSLDLAQRAIRQLGLTEKMGAIGAIAKGADGKPTVADAEFFMAMAEVGKGMYSEDTLFGSDVGSKNPFAIGTPDENSALQSKLINEDPERAEALIRAIPAAAEMYRFWLQGRARK